MGWAGNWGEQDTVAEGVGRGGNLRAPVSCPPHDLSLGLRGWLFVCAVCITSIILHTARFLCMIYIEIYINVTPVSVMYYKKGNVLCWVPRNRLPQKSAVNWFTQNQEMPKQRYPWRCRVSFLSNSIKALVLPKFAHSFCSGQVERVNPFTPESDQCQISPAASPLNITSQSM